jgi:hypothetical protein
MRGKKGVNRIIFLICSFLFLVGQNSFTSWAQEASGPKAVFPEKTFDFHQVDEGRELEHSFKVFNQGDQPLNIEDVKPG